MIDPLLSLALSVQANPGVYALLLGSGVSRSAGIPTGWEVVIDLARKLATAIGDDPEPDPVKWFEQKFGRPPSYSALLEAIGKTPAERTQLLRIYFEPSPMEREQGLKLPTTAHKAIASLVRMGMVRVILTTNFDRLIENALTDVGINPSVICSADDAEGAVPLPHSPCTVIKVHGDFLDLRTLNTPTVRRRWCAEAHPTRLHDPCSSVPHLWPIQQLPVVSCQLPAAQCSAP